MASVPVVPPGALAAYSEGRMSPEDAAEMEAAISSGQYRAPAGFTLKPANSVLDRPIGDIVSSAASGLREAVTGAKRQTEVTRKASDITLSPEWRKIQQPGLAPAPMNLAEVPQAIARGAYDATIGPLIEPVRAGMREAASPAEQVQMIQAANPGIEVSRDDAGNTFFVSPTDGKKYVIQPGFNATDLPRIGANILLAAPSGGVAGVRRAALAAAGTQAGLEAEQAASGGTFDPEDVVLAGVGGGSGEVIRRVMQGVRGARSVAPAVTEEAVEKTAQAAPEVLPGPELGRMVQAANAGDEAARRQVAAMADVDVDAAKAAIDLGLEVPIGVLAKNQQIGEINAALRAKMGSEAAGTAATLERDLAAKADEALEELGAVFSEGRVQPAIVSDRVLASLQSTREGIKNQAKDLYQKVDAAVRPNAPVEMANVRDVIAKRIEDYGMDPSKLSAAERRLYELALDPKTTYQSLLDEKAMVQKAMRNEMAQSPYSSVDRARLGALEAALKNDQLATVEKIGGAALRGELKTANNLTFKQKALESRAMAAFGKDLEGDLAPLMKRALAGAAKGENKALKQMLKIVPEENRREVVATALASIGRKPDGAFSPAVFAKNFPALRSNPEAYSALVKELGPSADKMLSAVYALSNRVAKSTQRTPLTGKALDELGALDGVMGKIAESALLKKAAVGVGAMAGAPVGSIGAAAGAAFADNLVNVLSSNKGRVIDAAATLMRDPSLVQLAIDQAEGRVSVEAVKAVARSAALREFLRAAKMSRAPSDAETWVWGAVRGGAQGMRAGEQE